MNRLYNMKLCFLLLSSMSLLAACASMDGDKATTASADAGTATQKVDAGVSEMEQRFGIKVESVRLTAANYMMNFTFKVLDAEKAAPIMDRKTNPFVILERNGSKFSVPVTEKLGAIRGSPKYSKEGKNYFMLFGNPGGYVKAGDRVTIEIGDFIVRHVVVM